MGADRRPQAPHGVAGTLPPVLRDRITIAGTQRLLETKGPYVQDRLGRRFIYLSWGTFDESDTFTMFRRAKLMLDAIPADVLAAAARDGLLVGRLGLTDALGGPLCARVEPPHITWTAARAD